MSCKLVALRLRLVLPALFLYGSTSLAHGQTGLNALNQIAPDRIEFVKKSLTSDSMSDTEVQNAITTGIAADNNGTNIGLNLEDSTQKWSNAFAAMGDSKSRQNQHSGFAVRLFTPRAWVAWNAHQAKRMFKPYTLSDVTESDRLQVLRVVVKPDTPDYVVARGGVNAASSVGHVVLRTENKKDALQPLIVEPYQVEVKNAMGGNLGYNGVVAIFSMADLDTLRKSSDGREFLVTVVREKGRERDFKVKEKHFLHLE